MQYRKRKTTGNLTKRVTSPSDKGRSTSGPVRFPSLPATLRNRPRGEGESTQARIRRLVRDTPPCQVCGTREGLTYRREDDRDLFRCPAHLYDSPSREVQTPARVRLMTRYNLSDYLKEH